MGGYFNIDGKTEYVIKLDSIMRQTHIEDIIVLTILYDGKTDQYSGVSQLDIYNDIRFDKEDYSETSLFFTLKKLEFIGAIGKYTQNRSYMYYIKETGWAMISYLQNE